MRIIGKATYIFALIFVFITGIGNAQNDSLGNDYINVFLDCTYCNKDHIKKEITFVNYVREPKRAQLHVIISHQTNGSGGRQYFITLQGQNGFANRTDTLKFSTLPTYTTEEIRSRLIRRLKLALASYAVNTTAAENMELTFSKNTENLIEDKWKKWVFEASVNSYMNGDDNYKYYYIWSNLEAKKISEKIKLINRLSSSYSKSIFELDGSDFIAINRTYNAYHLFGKSINEHWTIGEKANVVHASFSNYYVKTSIAPLIEFNIFPYSEATRRQFRFQYAISFQNAHYIDTTIYNKVSEFLLAHELKAGFEVIKKWGSLDLAVEYSNYLHDFELYNVDFNADLSIRLFKGVQFSIYGRTSLVHDQINLSKTGLSEEDILLRLKENSTNFRFFGSVGFTYTFGSLYSNIVNPRFDLF